MKKLWLGLMAIFASTALFAATNGEGIKFQENTTLAKVIELAGKENKYVFVDCYATWCGPCKRMANEVFTQKKVGDFFNKQFVSIAIDMEKGEGPEVAKKYGIKAYPTFLIMDKTGKLIGTIVGGDSADSFIAKVQRIIDAAK